MGGIFHGSYLFAAGCHFNGHGPVVCGICFYDTLIETGRSVVLIQRPFRNHFNVRRHDRVQNTIPLWSGWTIFHQQNHCDFTRRRLNLRTQHTERMRWKHSRQYQTGLIFGPSFPSKMTFCYDIRSQKGCCNCWPTTSRPVFISVQNSLYSASENPQELHEQPIHSERVTVWCAASRACFTGRYFFFVKTNDQYLLI